MDHLFLGKNSSNDRLEQGSPRFANQMLNYVFQKTVSQINLVPPWILRIEIGQLAMISQYPTDSLRKTLPANDTSKELFRRTTE